MKVWDSENADYVTYYLQKVNGDVKGWANYKTDALATDADTLNLGDAVWYINNGVESVDVTVKGEVMGCNAPHDIAGGVGSYTMIGSSFPVDFYINDKSIDWESCGAIAFAKGKKLQADQIKIWSNEANDYVTYYLQKVNGVVKGWANYKTDEVDDDTMIPAGAGAWYIRQSTDGMEFVEETPAD